MEWGHLRQRGNVGLWVLVLWASLLGLPLQAETAPQDNERPIIKVATGEWVPYVSASYPHEGAIGHIIELIFKRRGIGIEYGYFPWPRGYQLVLDGAWDATMPYYCSEERLKLYYCSDPIMSGQMVFFHRKDYPFDWKAIADIKGLYVGATLGYFYGEEFEKYEAADLIRVQRVAKDENNFLVLMKGRINLFPQDRAVGYSMIRRLFPPELQNQLTHHPRPLHEQPLHLIFPRNNAKSLERLELFNLGLEEMRKSGGLARILQDMDQGVYERTKK